MNYDINKGCLYKLIDKHKWMEERVVRNGLEVFQFSVDVFNWSKTIFIRLVFCTYGEE